MTDREFGRYLAGFVVAIILVVVWAMVTGPAYPTDGQTRPDTVTAERGPDWERIARRNGRRFAECHADLVRAQDRLRRLGHRWSEEAHGWVRVR